MSLGRFVYRRTPIEHSEEMSGANGSALLDDCLCGLLRRAGNELLIAECEPAGRGGRIWGLRAQALVLGHKAL